MKESRGITPLRTILRNCLNHIENLETNRSITDNYDKEFQDLKQFSETLKTQKEYSCTEGEKEVNRKKNRYKDILPFNISRVVLSEYAGIPGSDYINANYIKGASGSPAYIASQGPLPNTVNDFWRMVVECEVQVIVMACNAQESGKHKCENYWVEKEGEEKRFGMVQICLVKASTVCPDFLVRTMRLKYTNDKDVTEERTVCQFHYSAWPDHGVPPLVRPLLDMVRLVRDTQASETLPVLVHCSAGCGRTGTICAIDFVWGLLRAGKLTDEFSLFNLVKDMRKQRVAMVQTKEQYILVHQAVRELFKEQLRVIESHPYENIDFNGVPLIKDLEEPFYDTISTEKEENCDEKQDKSEMKNKGEDVESRINKGDAAPPLPRKKRPNVLFSKQEKEAENLTEKNRSSVTDATLSGLLGKPRIVKLRALFEKSANGKERTLKERGSQAVSRSHSLGAIRKPLSGEVLESPPGEKPKPSPPPTQPPLEPGKLKHSKSFSRSVPLIKRSRSLKTFGQSPHLCLSPPDNPVILKNFHQKAHDGEGSLDNSSRKPGAGSLTKECSKRRRSLESLMGDVPPSAGWGGSVEPPGTELRSRQKSLDWSPKASAGGSSSKTTDILKHQLQKLSLETERKINTFVTGIGIRERRNSFRQAVTKSEFQTKRPMDSVGPYRDVQIKSGPSFDQPDGGVYEQPKTKSPFDGRKYKVREKHSDGVKKVVARHQTSSGGPATVKVLPSKEPESRNLFLKKLNSEMYEIQRDRSSQEESEKSSRCNPGLIRSDSKRTLFRMSISVKPSGSYAIHSDTEVDGRGGEENERLFLQPSRPDIHRGKKPSSSECFKCYGAPAPAPAAATAGGTYARPSPPHKTLPLQGSSGEGSPSNRKPAPAKVHEIEVTFTSYRKALAPGSDVYGIADGSERKVSMPTQKRGTGKIKGYDHVTWGHPGPSRSSGDVSSSEHSSDSSKMGQHDAGENGVNLDLKVMKKPEQVRTRLGDPGSSKVIVNSEQSALQKRGDEGKMIPPMEFCNYGAGVVGTSKSRANSSEYSKDDFLLKEPTAPPRVKRHASVTGPRSAVNGSDHVTRWISTENKMAAGRNAGFQQDKNAWNGTIGVDLDAVAASMQQDKREISTVLKDGVWSGKNATTPVKKKQHYL